MADRVDKAWQSKGLEAYSTEAILGTLAHYGVRTDEQAFKDASKDAFPAQVAVGWLESWTGTGQFKGFPVAAAEVLFKRAWPERLVPSDFADTLTHLAGTLLEKVEGESADASEYFARAEAQLEKLPDPKELRERFIEDVVVHLGETATRAFDELGEALAQAGHGEDARRFAALEERMLPDRRGIASAVVRAMLGEREQALKELAAILEDGSTAQERRVMAVDALIHLDDLEQAKKYAAPLLSRAEAEQDFHLGLAMCERLAHVYDKLGQINELKALADRAQLLAKAHDEAHPHHGHHHG